MGVVFALVMNGLSYWYSDKWAIALNRARPIGENEYKQVQESVARLSVLAQVPVPSLYVIESNAMNAFATGRDYNHSALAVTSGLVARLTPEQLDGVLAHEIGHIKNYDIRLMALAGVLAGLVSIIANFFLRMSLFGGNNDERREGGVLLLALAFLFAILAPLFAQLLHLAISRKREFLADATSAYITKNPRGLASALREISRDAFPLTQAQPSTAHLFIANPFGKMSGLMALIERHDLKKLIRKILEILLLWGVLSKDILANRFFKSLSR